MAHGRKFYWIEFPNRLDVIFHFIDSFMGKLTSVFVSSYILMEIGYYYPIFGIQLIASYVSHN